MAEDDRTRLPLVGRDAELTVLERALAAARDGTGAAVTVLGPAGSGKTRLLAELAGRAAGVPVLQVRASAAAEAVPGVVVAALVRAGLALAGRSEQDLVGVQAPLRHLLGPAPVLPTGGALGHALYWWLSDLTEAAPLLLVVDDAQWTDALSLRLLAALLPGLTELPVLLTLGVREGEPTTGTAGVRALRAGSEVVSLGPLGEDAVLGLAAAAGVTLRRGSEQARRVLDLSQGNPLLVVELLHLAVRSGLPTDLAATDLDAELLALVARRLFSVEWAAAPLALAAVSLLDDEADLQGVAALLAVTPDEAGELVGQLVRAGLLQQAGDALTLVQGLVGTAATATLPAGARERLHARAAVLLHGRAAPAERVASHLVRTDRVDEPWAAACLAQAVGSARAAGDPAAASMFLRRALQLAGSDAERVGLLTDALAVGLVAGDPEHTLEHLREVAEAVGPHGVAAQLELGAAIFPRDPVEGTRVTERALVLAEELAPGLVAEAEGTLLLQVLGVPSARPLVEQRLGALLVRGREGDLSGLAPVQAAALASALLNTPDATAREVAAAAREALRDGELLSRRGPANPALWAATSALLQCDLVAEAEEAVERALGRAVADGEALAFTLQVFLRGQCAWYRGRVEDAAADAQASLDAGGASNPLMAPLGRALLGLGQLARGEADAALATLDPAVLAPAARESGTMVAFAQARGRTLLALGRVAEAEATFRELGVVVGAEPRRGGTILRFWRGDHAEALHALGRREASVTQARLEVEETRRFGSVRSAGRALRLLGTVLGGDEGLVALQQAVDLLAPGPAALEAGFAEVELGAALVAHGDARAGRAVLQRAREGCERLGITHLVQRVDAVTAGAAGSVPRQASPGGERPRLTPGERRVVELAVSGLTNREIAQSLFVSRKAVEWHLSNVYAKLGIRGKDQLTAAMP